MMNFDMAATDASQSRPAQAGWEAAPRNVSRLAPFAATLEVTPWIITRFEVVLGAGLEGGMDDQNSQIEKCRS